MLNFVEEYEAKCQNEENLPEGERYISIEEQENQIIIAIVDPFMRRVPSTSWCPRPVLRNAHFAIAIEYFLSDLSQIIGNVCH